MLKEQMKQYAERLQKGQAILFKEEQEYLKKNNMFEGLGDKLSVADASARFKGSYMERSEKELESLLAEESADFLKLPISYFRQHKNEFLYMESEWFEIIGVDAISLETDDLFENYDVMLGLKLQKKYSSVIRRYLEKELKNSDTDFDLIFEDAIWNLNFNLEAVDGFSETMSIGEAYELIYAFLFKLAESVEEQ
ncbi:branched-chain amino acid aminotransferase [Neobacillus terrae]|uniref:branched-chain amino acid aminotransferase n=1 Tax=Neobacillus terrae TaxID=3034837 RepID=UPI0014074B40|nr:branched-chain amino acid aminotransferase [Neobacillus terrae]NHM33958.1 branched-chain amino acid aminotransferase [Neobacillus terrae]